MTLAERRKQRSKLFISDSDCEFLTHVLETFIRDNKERATELFESAKALEDNPPEPTPMTTNPDGSKNLTVTVHPNAFKYLGEQLVSDSKRAEEILEVVEAAEYLKVGRPGRSY
jgi:hypothetical protein